MSLPGSRTGDSTSVPSTTLATVTPSPEVLLLEEQSDLGDDRSGVQKFDSLQALLGRCADLNLNDKAEPGRAQVQAGHSGFSDIYCGNCKLADGKVYKVAVKKLRVHVMSEGRDFEKLLAKELYIWSNLKHPRILSLEGFYFEVETILT